MSAPWWDDDYDGRAPSYRAYVSNISWHTDGQSLEDAFARYDPTDAYIIIDHETGRSRGFGFVDFKDDESLRDAIHRMNGEELDGRNITVKQANSRKRRRRR